MTDDDRQLLAYATGRMPAAEAAAFARRLEAEPELAARHRRLSAAWEGLELPPPAAPPRGLAVTVRRRAAAGSTRRPAPFALRAATLAAGLALGLGLGTALVSSPPAPSARVAEQTGEAVAEALGEEPGSLAELYWLALEQTDPAAADAAVDGGEATR